MKYITPIKNRGMTGMPGKMLVDLEELVAAPAIMKMTHATNTKNDSSKKFIL